jgi:hypothetical protein
MHLLRKSLIPLAAVAIIAMAISVVGPRAARAFTTTPPSFSPTAVRYPWTAICNLNGIEFTGSTTGGQNCNFGNPLPPGVVFVIQTITKSYNTTLPADSVDISIFTSAGGQQTLWTEHANAQFKFGGAAFYSGSAQTTLYNDPGTTPQVNFTDDTSSPKILLFGAIYLTGYYVYPPVPSSVN